MAKFHGVQSLVRGEAVFTIAVVCAIIFSCPIGVLNFKRARSSADRVFDYESKGHRFKSCRAHHKKTLKWRTLWVSIFRFDVPFDVLFCKRLILKDLND